MRTPKILNYQVNYLHSDSIYCKSAYKYPGLKIRRKQPIEISDLKGSYISIIIYMCIGKYIYIYILIVIDTIQTTLFMLPQK